MGEKEVNTTAVMVADVLSNVDYHCATTDPAFCSFLQVRHLPLQCLKSNKDCSHANLYFVSLPGDSGHRWLESRWQETFFGLLPLSDCAC